MVMRTTSRGTRGPGARPAAAGAAFSPRRQAATSNTTPARAQSVRFISAKKPEGPPGIPGRPLTRAAVGLEGESDAQTQNPRALGFLDRVEERVRSEFLP